MLPSLSGPATGNFNLKRPCNIYPYVSCPEQTSIRHFIRVLAVVFLSMLVIMFLFELTKQVLSPTISIWTSHAVTIVVTSIMAVIIVYFPLRSSYREQQKTKEALRLRQEAEENLRTSEMQYRSFVESVEDSIYTVDCDTRYLLINARHLARRGLSPQAYVGKKYEDFHSPAETRVFEEEIKKVIATKGPVQDEYEQDGRYFLRKLNPVIDPVRNEVVAVTVISSDITGQKLAERNLAIINRKLNLMNDITSHDMLNQLTCVRSLLSLAGEQSAEPLTKKYLIKSESAIDTIHAQILFSRDYQTIGVGSPQWQNISRTIQRAVTQLKIPSVTLDGTCNDLEIYADPLFEKVFYNLLENAVRYAGKNPEDPVFCTGRTGVAPLNLRR